MTSVIAVRFPPQEGRGPSQREAHKIGASFVGGSGAIISKLRYYNTAFLLYNNRLTASSSTGKSESDKSASYERRTTHACSLKLQRSFKQLFEMRMMRVLLCLLPALLATALAIGSRTALVSDCYPMSKRQILQEPKSGKRHISQLEL